MTKTTRTSKHGSVERWSPWPRFDIAEVVARVRLDLGGTHVVGCVHNIGVELVL